MTAALADRAFDRLREIFVQVVFDNSFEKGGLTDAELDAARLAYGRGDLRQIQDMVAAALFELRTGAPVNEADERGYLRSERARVTRHLEELYQYWKNSKSWHGESTCQAEVGRILKDEGRHEEAVVAFANALREDSFSNYDYQWTQHDVGTQLAAALELAGLPSNSARKIVLLCPGGWVLDFANPQWHA